MPVNTPVTMPAMQPLFSDAGRHRLDALVRPGMLCAFDFDGTLAPIVERPDDAVLPQETRALLMRLCRQTRVAIITGRAVDDIRPRLGFTPHFVVGNHGLEGLPGREDCAQRHLAVCSTWRRTLESCLSDMEGGMGIFLEDKRYSLSVHYRQTPDPARTERALHALLQTLHPVPRIVGGKAHFSLLPQDAGHKGAALEYMLLESGAAGGIYVGDDVTDEDVFRLGRSDLLTVRVEPGAESAAQFFLPALPDMSLLLRDLVRRVESAPVHA